jgi:hypothetical protein
MVCENNARGKAFMSEESRNSANYFALDRFNLKRGRQSRAGVLPACIGAADSVGFLRSR